jgi:Na+-transporting NADH:ubiquinone oxidoreductase subunit C
MKPETLRTFKVAVALCLVCSIIVSSLAVGLKPIQEEKKEEFRQQSILAAAGLWEEGGNAGQLFEQNIQAIGVNLEEDQQVDGDLSAPKFDMAKALQSPELHRKLPPAEDVAGLKVVENHSIIYRVPKEGPIEKLILPIRGKGLWSTLYGFIALDVSEIGKGPGYVKVAGLTYYKHGETPGLGGEVDNMFWKAKWPGKLVFSENWDVKVEVAKNPSTDYQVDALSGATLTSNGVSNMLEFWLGNPGFGPYLQKLAQQPASDQETASLRVPRF